MRERVGDPVSDKSCHAERGRRGVGDGPLTLAAVRAHLAAARGPQFWRSLEELAATPEFEEMLHREFPRQASEWPGSGQGDDPESADGLSRRRFLQLSSASLALAGLTACTRQPLEKIVPYVKQPEELIPGVPLYFASVATLGGYATGVLVESHMGRPTKIEGNPEHPSSLGATDALTQAEILGLYDPDRSQVITYLNGIATWQAFQEAIAKVLTAQRGLQGEGVRLLTGAIGSPALADQIQKFLALYPRARWHVWEPAGRGNAEAGARAAFGQPAEAHYDLAKADIVLALDSDFLTQGPGCVRYARDFADRRRLLGEAREMNRLYVVESTPSLTGAMADHRLALAPSEIGALVVELAAALGAGGAPAAVRGPSAGAERAPWLAAVARDLQAHRGRSLVIAGDALPPAAHAVVHAINAALGNAGATVLCTEPIAARPADGASLAELATDIRGGRIDFLVFLGTNPVYDAPADYQFADLIQKVPLRVHHGLYQDETAEYCHWHVPQAHWLESWGDGRAHDGTAAIQQPLIEPLYGGKSALELVAALNGEEASGLDLVKAYWQGRIAPGDAADSEAAWRRTLHDGVVRETAPLGKAVAVDGGAVAGANEELAAAPAASDALELAFRPDPAVGDGRHANLGWLQELPRPLTKLTWDNALMVAPALAERLGLETEDVAQVWVHSVGGTRGLKAPVWVMPGQAERAVTLHLGYGRWRAGRVGNGVGVNAYALRTSGAPWTLSGVEIARTGERHRLVSTQMHQNIEAENVEGEAAARRHLVRVGTLGEYAARPEFAREMEHHVEDVSLNPEHPYTGYAWGMAVDLNACTGCNACVVACQAENNIPVVGKEQVAMGREMHWIRIDRYFAGDLDHPAAYHQPVMCQHCEQAPCEVVCPVAATVHSAEGLNDMVYNRCIGTRYCSNNCPYKVRRFNFLAWNKIEPNDARSSPVLELLRNPDVTVRFRGVMEKCTYCVQRINAAKIASERESRKVRDGEIRTACQQSCPTQAIVFGDVNDAESQVSKWKAEPRNYGILTELNTRPRTTYLARVRNPNPELEPPAAGAAEAH